MGRQKQTIQQKVQKKFPDFVQEIDRLSVADLNTRIASYAKAAAEHEEKKNQDEYLEKLSEEVAERRALYTEPIKEIRLKSRYMAALIKEKGGQ